MATRQQVSPVFAAVVIVIVLAIVAVVYEVVGKKKISPSPGGEGNMKAGMLSMQKKAMPKGKAEEMEKASPEEGAIEESPLSSEKVTSEEEAAPEPEEADAAAPETSPEEL